MLTRSNCLAPGLTAAILLFCGASTFAQTPAVKRDIAFSRELNEMTMYDFSTRFLEERLAENKNAATASFYRVQLAETMLSAGKFDDAQKMINGIPKTDPAYYSSLGSLGVYYFLKKDNQKALQSLEPMYQYLKKAKADPSEYERPLTALLNVYYQLGRDNDAASLLDWTRGTTSDRRAAMYTKAMMQLTTAENNRRAEQREKAAFQRRVSDLMKDKSKQTELTRLLKRTADLTDAVVHNKGNYNDNQRARAEEYKKLGEAVGMNLDRLMKIDELDLSRKGRADRLKNREKLSSSDKASLRKIDPNDWQTTVLSVCVDFQEIQWGGQDMLTAYATAQLTHCFYLLGIYEESGVEVRKYPDLFEASDEALEKDGKKNESPAADAKFWTGRSYLALAEETEAAAAEKKSSDLKKQAVIYYRRAFKYLGKLVKYYPQFKDAPAAYQDFKRATENAMAIDPDKKSTYQSEFSKVKAPVMTDKSTLVSAWAEQNYQSRQYNLVIDELLPILQSNASRYTPGLSELVNRLIMSYAYLGDSTEAVILSNYIAMLPKDDFVTTAILNAGHLLWQASAKADNPAEAAQLKGDALTLYRILLDLDMLNPYAGIVSLRVAREHLNSASRIGTALNASTDAAERTALKKKWTEEVNKAAASYKVIVDNFGNNPELTDEAYMKYADCQAMLDHYPDAIETLRKFCAFGPSSPKVAAVTREIIAEMLSREAEKLADSAASLRDEAVPGDTTAIEKADKLNADAAVIYDEAAAELLELRAACAKGGEYAAIAKEPELVKVMKRADALLPWLYDGAAKRDKAIAEFDSFVRKYPNDPLASSYLMRIGIIYMDMGRDSEAQKILSSLVSRFPDSAEAKNAQYVLARTLYVAGNYEKALELFDALFAGEQAKNLSISNLRWIASNLAECPNETFAKRAAERALSVSGTLLMKVRDPDLEEWFSAERAASLKSDKAAARKAVERLEQRVLLDAGKAAIRAEQYDKAVENLSKIELLEKDTPYFYDLHFAMADIRGRQKRPDEARSELSKISVRANQTGDFSLYNKAQVLTGESFLADGAVNKAYACFGIVASAAFPDDDAEASAAQTAAPDEAALPWMEQAVYRTAYTAALLGLTGERDEMVRKYKKYFPDGKYKAEIEKLPESQAQ